MEIKDFKERKAKLERDLTQAMVAIIIKFEHDTGYMPNKINVHMKEDSVIGSFENQYYLSEVKTEIEI